MIVVLDPEPNLLVRTYISLPTQTCDTHSMFLPLYHWKRSMIPFLQVLPNRMKIGRTSILRQKHTAKLIAWGYQFEFCTCCT